MSALWRSMALPIFHADDPAADAVDLTAVARFDSGRLVLAT